MRTPEQAALVIAAAQSRDPSPAVRPMVVPEAAGRWDLPGLPVCPTVDVRRRKGFGVWRWERVDP